MVQLPETHILKIFCILIVWYSKAHVLQEIYILGNHSIIVVQYWVCWKNFLQVVVNANKLAKLVKKKKKLQNWLDYYQLKYSRNNSKRPMMKVINLICHQLDMSFCNLLILWLSLITLYFFFARLVFLGFGEKKWTVLIITYLKLKNCQKKWVSLLHCFLYCFCRWCFLNL